MYLVKVYGFLFGCKMETRYTTDEVREHKTASRMSGVLPKPALSGENVLQTVSRGNAKFTIDDPRILGYNTKYLPRKSPKIIESVRDNLCVASNNPSIGELGLISHIIPPTIFVGSPEDSFMSHLEMRIDNY